ncbi:MAG: hypothetical protein Q7J46_13965 [Pseudomonas sp.]|nr:hypothetical protein [Pseudomonas sp.]
MSSKTHAIVSNVWSFCTTLRDAANLPEPDDLAEDIIKNIEAGLASFREVLAGLTR